MFDYLAVNGKLPVCIPIIVRFDRNLIFEGKFLLDEKVADVLFDGVGDTVFGCALFPHGSGRTP